MMPDDNSDKVVALIRPPENNTAFLMRIFADGVVVWTNNTRKDPNLVGNKELSNRHFSPLPSVVANDEAASNTYFCISTFKQIGTYTDGKAQFSKKIEHFVAMYLVVIDDVGTKGPSLEEVMSTLTPTYVIETSPGNYQVGYALAVPCQVKARAKHLMDSLNHHIGDKGSKGINRVVRLPYGVNTKASVVEANGGIPFKVKFVHYDNVRYTEDQIEEAFGIPYVPKSRQMQAPAPVEESTYYTPTLEEYAEALALIDPVALARDRGAADADEKLGWLEHLMIAKYTYGDAALPIMQEWSARDPARYCANPNDWVERWEGLKVGGSGGDTPLTMGSFIHDLQRHYDLQPPWMIDRVVVEGELSPNYLTDRSGTPKSCVSNAVLALDFINKYEFTYDEFTANVYVNGDQLREEMVTRIRIDVERELNNSMGKDNTFDAILSLAKHNAFDSLQDYVNGLPQWDGTDYIQQYCDLLGLPKDSIERVFVRKWFIGCIARALQPGCKVDTGLILYSERQGTGKSSGLAALVPQEDWFTDQLHGNVSNKDELLKLAGKWIVEMGELANLKISNNESMKQFMSARSDEYRPPYGRINERFPRRCGIAGSTNERRVFSDKENRRYWPIEIETDAARKCAYWLSAEVDGQPERDAAQLHMRDLLWSQVKHLYDEGGGSTASFGSCLWWLTPEEEDEHFELASGFRKHKVVEQHVHHWIEEESGPFQFDSHIENAYQEHRAVEGDLRQFVKLEDIEIALQGKMQIRPSPYDIAGTLEAMGWHKHPPREPGQKSKSAGTYGFKLGGRQIKAPRGYASPELHSKLMLMKPADRARAILAEVGGSTTGD